MIRKRQPTATAGPKLVQRTVQPSLLSGRAMRALLARVNAGDATARRLLVQRIGETAGNAATATVPPAPCNLTATTVVPVAGDLSDDEALEATRTLPDFVQDGNGGGHQLTTDCRRREFMRWAREWFGSYRGAIAHYGAMNHATGIPGSPVVAVEVAPRLQAVAAELGADMPSTTTAFSFRRQFAGAHPAGTSMHTLGYALDYDATLMPRIGRDETALLIELMTGGNASAQLGEYSARRAIIRRMGDRATAGTAATQGDAQAQTLLTTLSSELTRIGTASSAFQQVLGAHGADFLELRTRYFEAATADRAAILAEVTPLLQPFYDAIARDEATPDLAGPRRTLLTALRAKLTDPAFLFGRATHGRAPRGRGGQPPAPTPRPGTAVEVDTPSLAQLLEHGWFNPGTGGVHWGIRFADAMARQGFDGGFGWGGAFQDSMHFELVITRPYTPPASPRAAAPHH